ncbi:hypothetical protein SAMN02745126_03309 [Enhydrobacter aerosaccus]|uniref:DUF4239 domain-containing protein n=1 Tax=Enhydrobacter aerosaccus TaxID=225324 RepID=A0A1T4QLV0_9HYPH|nr:hypothetical protein [Enhydrobacter aerosaccus]SKA04712.1 hypothetical protein SAMN02745126_03309 [Enhydrobacter aerosaccus]
MLDLNSYPLWLILLVSTAAIAAAAEAGRQYGLRNAARGGGGLGALEGAVLGLLTLMISFTFAMALSRFDGRRQSVVDEANAIGTAGLRARLLPAPINADSVALIKDYLQIRVEGARNNWSDLERDAAIARSGVLQEKLWQLAKQAQARDAGMVPTGLYLQSLNEMFDNHEKRLAMFRDHVPNIVLLALYGFALVGLALAGYSDGLDKRLIRLPIHMMGILVSLAIILIQDLDRSTTGFLRVDLRPLTDTVDTFANFKD